MDTNGEYSHPLYVETVNFSPPLTGKELCRSLGPIVNHVLAVLPKGRDTWEIHVTTNEIRDHLEVEGLTLRGRHCEVTTRFPKGTWVRIRGIPLNVPNDIVNGIVRQYGDIIVGTSHATWRNTNIKTGDRTVKIKLAKDIPGRVRYTTYGWISYRYKNQPEVCFQCGKSGHQQWECSQQEEGKKSYASAIEALPANAPLTPSEESDRFCDSSNSEERGDGEEKTERKKKKKEKKEKKRERKERKREHISPEMSTEIGEARHEGLPQVAPVFQLKVRKT